jgi:hypothetical protein
MAAITPSATYTGSFANQEALPNAIDGGIPRFKVGYLTCPDTADATNTIDVDVYAKWGMIKVLAFEGFVHTTTNSVVAEETYIANTFTGTVLSLTIPAGTNDDKRFIVVYGI